METYFRAIALLLIGVAGSAAAQEGPKRDRVDVAVDRAIAYIAGMKQPTGAISDVDHHPTAMTSLAVMAMASVGHQPMDPTIQGKAMKAGLDYVLSKDRQDVMGYFGGPDKSRMYGHGITTLMLSEMLGMGVSGEQNTRIKDRLERAVQLILRAQMTAKRDDRHRGGWRYDPNSPDSDLSSTVWQVMSLRSAKHSGVNVPDQAIDRAVEYLKRSYFVKKGETAGACGYLVGQSPRYAMGAAGLLALQVCGEYESPEVKGSADWLKGQKLDPRQEWFFYGTYYYSQGTYQRGGDQAKRAQQQVVDVLLPRQDKEGSWTALHAQEKNAGRVYATSLAILSLAVKYHYLPIYQR